MPFSFAAIEQDSLAVFQTLRSGITAYSPLFFTNHGGADTGCPWQTCGFYVQANRKGRLVLEVLFWQTLDTCVVRVYRESRLTILHARKLVGQPDRLTSVLEAASAVFVASLPARPFGEKPEAEQARRFLASWFGSGAVSLLDPVPPPCNIAQTEEA